MRMNIAEIATYKEGGVYTHVAELVKRLQHPSLIITGNSKLSGFQKEGDLSFFHIPCMLSLWEIYFITPPGSYKKVRHVITGKNIDLLHFHNPLFTFGGALLRKSTLPKIMTTHYVIDFKGNRVVASLYKSIIRWITKSIAKHVDVIICVNNEYLPIYKQWGIDEKKLVMIPNGIDTNKFSPGPSSIKKKLGCKHLLVYWGRLGYQKNIAFLIDAFKTIKTPNTKLAIIGKGPDLKKLQALAGDSDNVLFPGYLPDDKLLEYARGADIAVLPSRGESWGLVIGEAMACGLPVISSDVGMAQELLGDGRGIILKKETTEGFAGAIDALLSDKKNAQVMGKKARSFIVDRYSWDQVTGKIEELYQQVISSKHSLKQVRT